MEHISLVKPSVEFASNHPVLYAWKSKCHSYYIQVVAQAAGVSLHHIPSDSHSHLEEFNEHANQQVPYLIDGTVKLADNNAIVRYISHNGGLDCENEDYAVSERIIAQTTDVLSKIDTVFVHGSEHKTQEIDAFFAPNGAVIRELVLLERLLPELPEETHSVLGGIKRVLSGRSSPQPQLLHEDRPSSPKERLLTASGSPPMSSPLSSPNHFAREHNLQQAHNHQHSFFDRFGHHNTYEYHSFFKGNKHYTGDYVVAALLDVILTIEPNVLRHDTFPKLRAFYDVMITSPAFHEIKDFPVWPKDTAGDRRRYHHHK